MLVKCIVIPYKKNFTIFYSKALQNSKKCTHGEWAVMSEIAEVSTLLGLQSNIVNIITVIHCYIILIYSCPDQFYRTLFEHLHPRKIETLRRPKTGEKIAQLRGIFFQTTGYLCCTVANI
jgi:hypothetical protein